MPASPAGTVPCAGTTSTALSASAKLALMESCVRLTSLNALTGEAFQHVIPIQTSKTYEWREKKFEWPTSDMTVCACASALKDYNFFSSSCLNNGTCVDGINDFVCRCRPGFYGVFCEYEQNECDSQPCKNGGTCTDGLGTYRCTCPVGYHGQNCQVWSVFRAVLQAHVCIIEN